MFWIVGAGAVVRTLSQEFPSLVPFAEQLSHSPWAGLRFYDLIFPLFMFIAGVAIPLSLGRKLELGTSNREILVKVLRRTLLLIVLGIVYNGGLSFEQVRFASVLGQIGIAYFIAAMIFLYARKVTSQVAWLVGILLGYSAIQFLVPVPGIGMGVLTPEGSVNSWIDQLLLPGRLHGGTYDPEGILCTLSASAITLTGTLAGRVLQRDVWSGNKKALILALSGVGFLLLGLSFSPVYPIVKRIWTTTFNLTTGGICLLLMALFYWAIDVKRWTGWTLFFRVIGLNAITIYLAHRIVDFETTSEFLFGGLATLTGIEPTVVIALGVVLIGWILLYFLYKKRIFLRV
jgi:predicted acyltransferase